MSELGLSSAFSQALYRLIYGAPNRRDRRRLWWNASLRRANVSSRRRLRLSLETLEDRITPTTFTPTTFADDGTLNSLRGDITRANNDDGTSADTIQLLAGTYTLTIANSAGHENANAQGDLNIKNGNHPLVIQGATDPNTGKPATTIQQTVLDRVFQIVDQANPVTFKNLIIEGGQAQDDGESGAMPGTSNAEGGGILAAGGSVTLSNVMLQSNSADAGTGFGSEGGGIYAGDPSGSLTIESSFIQSNKVLGGAGGTSVASENGGLAAGGGIFAFCSTNITDTTLSSNTVTGGDAGTGRGGAAAGGSIFAAGSTTITTSELLGNILTGGNGVSGGGSAEGGDVYLTNVSAGVSLALNTCSLSINSLQGGNATAGPGGYAEGGSVFVGKGTTTTLTNSTLETNTLIGGFGNFSSPIGDQGDVGGAAEGGSLFDSAGTTTISASTLSNNSLTGGKGILANSSATVSGDVGGEALGGSVFSSGVMNISTSSLFGNNLKGGTGVFHSGLVDGNVGGSASGGGLYVSSNGPATLTALDDSTLSNNTLTGGNASGGTATPGLAQGGGVSLQGSGNTLVNSTIADNQLIGGQGAPGTPVAAGGGMYIPAQTVATLTNVTVADNKASLPSSGSGTTRGGGIDNSAGTVTLVNTLVALNSATSSPDYSGAAASGSGHNLIGNADGSSGFSTAHGDLLGNSANPLNPQLGPLANNGGPTQTLALLPGSPAINAGDNSAQSTTGPFDQRGQGFTRVFNGTIDIGAFEVQPPPSPPPSPTPPPTLHKPPLLALIDGLLGGIETVNGNGTETVRDSFFGIPLFVSVYNSSGNLTSVTLFGINVTFVFELPL